MYRSPCRCYCKCTATVKRPKGRVVTLMAKVHWAGRYGQLNSTKTRGSPSNNNRPQLPWPWNMEEALSLHKRMRWSKHKRMQTDDLTQSQCGRTLWSLLSTATQLALQLLPKFQVFFVPKPTQSTSTVFNLSIQVSGAKPSWHLAIDWPSGEFITGLTTIHSYSQVRVTK